jgi:hypothetical protein
VCSPCNNHTNHAENIVGSKGHIIAQSGVNNVEISCETIENSSQWNGVHPSQWSSENREAESLEKTTRSTYRTSKDVPVTEGTKERDHDRKGNINAEVELEVLRWVCGFQRVRGRYGKCGVACVVRESLDLKGLRESLPETCVLVGPRPQAKPPCTT